MDSLNYRIRLGSIKQENAEQGVMWDCPQAQGTVTAVQLQTEAPVATATGQQVQTLQVVV